VELNGTIVEGSMRPSSDLPTHLVLYRAFESIGGVVHTHSHFAAVWAQSQREIPCLGTTHADYFHGAIPVTAPLAGAEIQSEYEANTGEVIVRRFRDAGLERAARQALSPQARAGRVLRAADAVASRLQSHVGQSAGELDRSNVGRSSDANVHMSWRGRKDARATRQPEGQQPVGVAPAHDE